MWNLSWYGSERVWFLSVTFKDYFWFWLLTVISDFTVLGFIHGSSIGREFVELFKALAA
jgi:hypothetical protein